MNSTVQPNYRAGAYRFPIKARETKQAGAQGSRFLDLAAQTGKSTSDTLEIDSASKITRETEASNIDAYMEHLKDKYGRVTIESIGKDPESLEKAGRRMSGHDVVIAPNILADMAGDPKKALHYERKIDYFFNTVIPQGNAICAAKGLVFEPCGVVVHEDGSVTYICGCSDSPERVAEVNRINAEKAKKKAAQRLQYQEQSAAAAAQRRAMWERTAETAALEKAFSNINDLLKTRMSSTPAVTPEASLPAGTNMFLFNI